jgi:hypothetical protein
MIFRGRDSDLIVTLELLGEGLATSRSYTNDADSSMFGHQKICELANG